MKIYLVLDDDTYGYQTPNKAFTSEAAADAFADSLRACETTVVEIDLVEEDK